MQILLLWLYNNKLYLFIGNIISKQSLRISTDLAPKNWKSKHSTIYLYLQVSLRYLLEANYYTASLRCIRGNYIICMHFSPVIMFMIMRFKLAVLYESGNKL
jgi:hypothetical protein